MDAFAVCAQACEGDGHVLIKFNCNLKKIHVARSGMEINCSISLPEFGRQSKCEGTAGSQLLSLQTKHCKTFCVCRMLRVFGRSFLNFLLQQGPLVVKGQFRQATKLIFTVFFFFPSGALRTLRRAGMAALTLCTEPVMSLQFRGCCMS